MTFELFAWILVPLVPALVALYFLKLKRQEVLVSSTFLWKRSLEDLHVNSPFQRLRRSLLLLLQLLILLALIAAASRPIISALGTAGISRIVLVDNSASMNVREEDGTRLEIALRRARSLVEGMKSNDSMALISFSNRSTVVQPLTHDSTRLRAAIATIRPTSNPTDFLPALRTAVSVAESTARSEVVLLSDGCFGALQKIAPELERLELRYFAIGEETENTGIIETDVRRDFGREQRLEIFASVRNAGSRDTSVNLSLHDGDQLVDGAVLEIPAGRTRSHVFDGSELPDRVLRLEIDRGGALADDDRAWLRIDPPRPLELLLVGEKSWFLEKVVGAQPLFRGRRIALDAYLRMAADGRLESDPADVVIFNGRAPEGPPDRSALYIGCFPRIPELLSAREEKEDSPGTEEAAAPGEPTEIENPVIVDRDVAHPVNRFLVFADLLISRSYRFERSSRYHSLIDADRGSIAGTLILTPSGKPALSVVILGFDITNTNWPWLPSFPMFFSNALSWLGSASGNRAVGRHRTGSVLVHQPPRTEEEDFVMRDPRGGEFSLAVNPSGELVFADTALTGVYELFNGEERLARFPVSLLSDRETRVAPGKEIRFGSSRVTDEPGEIPETRDLWKWFAVLALLIVLLEWWVYNRRMTL